MSDFVELKRLAIELCDELRCEVRVLEGYVITGNIIQKVTRSWGRKAAALGIATVAGIAGGPVAAVAVASGFCFGFILGAVAVEDEGRREGSRSAKVFIEKRNLNRAAMLWARFCQKLKSEMVKRNRSRLGKQQENLGGRADGAAGNVNDSGPGATNRAAARVASVFAQRSAVSIVRLVDFTDLHDIIDGILELHRDNGPDAGECLRRLADSLEELTRYESLDAYFDRN